MSTVLAVDDEEDILQVVDDYLTPEGYKILKALNGREALKLAQTARPAAILLDISMPFMDGFAVLELLAANTETARIPVIMLTAQGQTKNILEAERFRVHDFLIKPFTRDDLLTALRSAIG